MTFRNGKLLPQGVEAENYFTSKEEMGVGRSSGEMGGVTGLESKEKCFSSS